MVQDKRQAPGRAGTSAGSETAGGSGAEDPRCVRAAGDGIGRGVHRVVRTPGVARYAQARIGHRRLRRHRGHLDGRHARIVRGAGRKRTAGRHDATGAGQQPGEDLGVTGRLETQDTGDRIARVGDLTLAVGRLDGGSLVRLPAVSALSCQQLPGELGLEISAASPFGRVAVDAVGRERVTGDLVA